MTRKEFIELLSNSPKWTKDSRGNFTYNAGAPGVDIYCMTGIDFDFVYVSIKDKIKIDPFTEGVEFMSDKRPYSDFGYCDKRNIIYTDFDCHITLAL